MGEHYGKKKKQPCDQIRLMEGWKSGTIWPIVNIFPMLVDQIQ